MSGEVRDPARGPVLGQDEQSAQTVHSIAPDQDNIDLSLRFLVGLLSLGSDEVARRLQEMQHQLDEDPTLWSLEGTAGAKTLRRQAWYLGVGLAKIGQRRLRRGVRQGYVLSRRAASRVSSASDRLGLSRLTRPVRRPVEARLAEWHDQAALIIKDGELEDQKGRALATGTLAALIVEIMDEVAENPELQDFVQSLIGQQGVGMATSMVDNARAVTVTADDTAERLLRWLLRRTPRRELPPSPVAGQPQTMYVPTATVEGDAPDVD